jgi:hypothetical protein
MAGAEEEDMSTRIWVGAALAAGLFLAASPARATDPWDSGHFGDDTAGTLNTLGSGAVQVHDLDQAGGPTNDVDWMRVPTLARHSYEARIHGANQEYDWGACAACAQFERVNSAGTVLTEDVSTVNEGAVESYVRSVRWIASANQTNEFIRVTGDTDVTETSNDLYTLSFWDTTYSIPRWNSSGSQSTVLMITNLTQGAVTVTVHFYSSTGTLLASTTFSLLQNQESILNTASIAALAGQSGHAHVVHNAGYGGLSGKAVALEPSTGFTFDTAMIPIAQ